MNTTELDSIFSVLENPIRRKILAKLAKEHHYPLQLSKELNISQQAIMKHLKVLEDNGLVQSFEEKSTLGGPPRKCYVGSKHISLRIDIGPSTFNSEVYDYTDMDREKEPDEVRDKERIDDEFKVYIEEFKKCQSIEDPKNRLAEYSKIIQKLNQELYEIKVRSAKLLNIREVVTHESNRLINELSREYEERRILYYLLNHEDRELSSIADALELREKVIMDIFNQLIKRHLLIFEEEFII
jgi:predicted transcriptional regulator